MKGEATLAEQVKWFDVKTLNAKIGEFAFFEDDCLEDALSTHANIETQLPDPFAKSRIGQIAQSAIALSRVTTPESQPNSSFASGATRFMTRLVAICVFCKRPRDAAALRLRTGA